MSARDLLEDLRGLGVTVEVKDGFLDLDAPAGVITQDLIESLTEHKPHLLKLLTWEHRKLEEADRRGLIIRWSEHPMWIKLHDPTTGEWHEVKASECLPSVVETANKYRRKKGAES
ncbi:MAG: hypothetical protein CYG60_21980 [Actinobacteria bacterium]|nr:MAG: hypothetical protein CYG60_21980 [Actinomycetota bacterium]